ncbi:flagellar basal-body rod protein FlgF [bacterium]|nr:flagellar basal-body rod protein FlgF [bacterium]
MTNGIYAAVLGARIEGTRLDVIANNVANAGTPGFRADRALFSTHLDFVSDDKFNKFRKTLDNVGRYFQTASTFTSGPIQFTGREGDAAIEGEGYFVLQGPNGDIYTRAGNFRVDTDGTLRSASGFAVMGEGGPITVDPTRDLSFGPDGAVFSGGEQVDRLRVAAFEDQRLLRKAGGTGFTGDAAAPKADPEFTVVNGALEGSNVNVMREMAGMVTTSRQYESYQRTIKMIDEVNGRATSLGRI